MPGKPADFSDEENQVLRDALRRLKDEHGLKQAAIGRRVGMTQQNVARLLSTGRGGMGRKTANRLARELGFHDVEALLLEAGVSQATRGASSGKPWSGRDAAVTIARQAQIDEDAIRLVVERYGTPEDQRRPLKWWLRKFTNEDHEIALERAEAAASKRTHVPSVPTTGSRRAPRPD